MLVMYRIPLSIFSIYLCTVEFHFKVYFLAHKESRKHTREEEKKRRRDLRRSWGKISDMVLLCFLLDLRTISPPVLRDLKQCLLQLANHYAISRGRCDSKQSEKITTTTTTTTTDRLGLCYIQKNRISCVDELKIAYSPRASFRLRDFHHAVNNLPADGFLPELIDSFTTRIAADVTLAKLLSDEALFSWGGGRDIVRKVIVISSCLVDNIDSVRKILADAADKCVSVEFVLLEQEPLQPQTFYEDFQEFINSTSDLENCSVGTHLPDTRVLCGLVKRWLQELRDELDEPLQAVFLFKNHLAGSTNRIFCNLVASVDQIIDGFVPCQTCRCHGLPLDSSGGSNTKRSSLCPKTYQELGTNNTMENAARVGEHTVLFLPSFQSCPNFQQVSSPISFSVIERTNLGTLSEGVIVGNSYTVTPSPCQEMEATTDECDKSELNTQVFQGLCRVLHSLDQGLVCTSNCNMETKRDATFHCFYILQPSEKGPMLLRRLAGSEEILPFPDSAGSTDFIVPKEIQNSIQSSLSRMELRDYNPLLHERGFHPKLNLLVKESLHFGSVPPRLKELSSEPSLPRPEPAEMTKLLSSTKITGSAEEHEPKLTQATRGADKTAAAAAAARFTEEWEQLVINEDCKMICSSPACVVSSRPRIKATSLELSPADRGNKQLDEKTSRILERLEAPRKQPKTSGSAAVIIISSGSDACLPKKKPLVPFAAPTNHATEQSMTPSQPLRPNFQRLKRKQRYGFSSIHGFLAQLSAYLGESYYQKMISEGRMMSS